MSCPVVRTVSEGGWFVAVEDGFAGHVSSEEGVGVTGAGPGTSFSGFHRQGAGLRSPRLPE